MNEAAKWVLRTLLVLLVVGAFVFWPFAASCILIGAVLTAFILYQGVRFFFRRKLGGKYLGLAGAHGHMLLNENDAPLLPVSAPNSKAAKAADATMAGLDGFEPAGVFRYSGNNNAGAYIEIHGYVHAEHSVYAAVYTAKSEARAEIELITPYADGTSLTYSTYACPKYLRSPENPIVYLPNAGGRELLAACLNGRRQVPAEAVGKDDFAEKLAAIRLAEHRWLREAGEFNEKADRALTLAFLDKNSWSGSEWERRRENIVFVHERLSPWDVSAMYLRPHDDTPERESLSGKVVAVPPGFVSRIQAFGHLLDEFGGDAFVLIDELAEPEKCRVYELKLPANTTAAH